MHRVCCGRPAVYLLWDIERRQEAWSCAFFVHNGCGSPHWPSCMAECCGPVGSNRHKRQAQRAHNPEVARPDRLSGCLPDSLAADMGIFANYGRPCVPKKVRQDVTSWTSAGSGPGSSAYFGHIACEYPGHSATNRAECISYPIPVLVNSRLLFDLFRCLSL